MSTKQKIAFSGGSFTLKKEHFQTDAYYGMNLSRVGPGLILSRSGDGSVISLFDDNVWFLPQFAFSVRDNPYFNFKTFLQNGKFREENLEICKRLVAFKMFSKDSKTGKAIRLTTMQRIILALRQVSTFSNLRDIRIQEVFGSKQLFDEMLENLLSSNLISLLALVRTLSRIERKERGFSIDGSILPTFEKIARRNRKESNQHAVIPSRILWAKYNQYKTCLNDYLSNKVAIHNFIKGITENRFFGRNFHARIKHLDEFLNLSEDARAAIKQRPVSFWQAVKIHDLEKLAHQYQWSTTQSAISFLSLVQHCAKCLIHIFTLMRDGEVFNLPTDCLEPITGWNNEAIYLCGTSTKLESERTPAKWITTNDVCRPIEVLQSIQKLIKSCSQDNIEADLLLLPASNLPYSNNSTKKESAITTNLDHKLPPTLITEADIRELEDIDPYRNWRGDKRFKIGQPWRITSHQFRRSIAVFAGQSGLITLPSLKRLLRHITKAMATYYMKGCSVKNYLLSDLNPQLARELKQAKEEADAAIFIRDVLKSAEHMYGFAGHRAMEIREGTPWLAGNLNDTKQHVKLGLQAYQETPAGGCTSPTPCDKRAHAKMDTCITCNQFIGQESKMAETIEIMEFDLAELQPGTIEHRAELQNLEDFKALCSRVIARG